MNRYLVYVISIFTIWNISSTMKASAEDEVRTKAEELQLRMDYYFRYQEILIPWYYLAAIGQYGRNIQDVRLDIPKRESVVAIQFSDEYWSVALNPMKSDMVLSTHYSLERHCMHQFVRDDAFLYGSNTYLLIKSYILQCMTSLWG